MEEKEAAVFREKLIEIAIHYVDQIVDGYTIAKTISADTVQDEINAISRKIKLTVNEVMQTQVDELRPAINKSILSYFKENKNKISERIVNVMVKSIEKEMQNE